MSLDRTPDEWASDVVDEAAIELAIDHAVEDYASYMLAVHLDLDADEIEARVDQTYDGLRGRLSRQQLIRAVLLLVQDRAHKRACAVLDGIEVSTS